MRERFVIGLLVFPMRVGMNRAGTDRLAGVVGVPHACGDEPERRSI